MRTIDVPHCPNCGKSGSPLHSRLEDRLFGAPGKWNIRRCSHVSCGTLWIDPAPHPEDLGLAYQNYYTHAPTPHQLAGLLNDKSHRGYASLRLGYPYMGLNGILRGLKLLFKFREIERAQFFRFYLRWRQGGGRVLDVGCGAGNELVLLNQLGWQAEGLDPDPNAVHAATAAGLKVSGGDLLSVTYPENTFNAVTMSHVVEHLIDSPKHLAAAFRILKPGGRLVVITPNADSLGHRRYGPDWRGLEPPRHLQIYTLRALKNLVGSTGFTIERARSSARDAGYLLLFSEKLRDGFRGLEACTVPPGTWPPGRLRRLEYWEGLAARLGIHHGEELLIVARKPASPDTPPHA